MLKRYYYCSNISKFISSSDEELIGILTLADTFDLGQSQKEAWGYQIEILKKVLKPYDGTVCFEYAIPRMGRRIDAVVIIKNAILILEFKIGEKEYSRTAIDQVWDYSLDLKNFHEPSRGCLLAPILVATDAPGISQDVTLSPHNDKLLIPLLTNSNNLSSLIGQILEFAQEEIVDSEKWMEGRYSPTPTIIEAAIALYNNHSVSEITRSDSEAINLSKTSNRVSQIIENAKENNIKAICFVTGVPGSGKTLVGLDVATKHMDKEGKTTSVYLSGNGPLVAILREALTRDKVLREKERGKKIRKGNAFSAIKTIIQNVHNFRDYCLGDQNPPIDHVAIFDEAQRAWDQAKTSDFMKRRKKIRDFKHSEPEFLISCLDRHKDWAVVVCLVGGGQEIHTGEAGISEWIDSIKRHFPEWEVYVSDRLTDSEYAAGHALEMLSEHKKVVFDKDLHLSVSMRSFRAENLSHLVKNILDLEVEQAREHFELLKQKYPIVITRELSKAKKWLREKARGSERYGLVVSSQAERLKPLAIDVKSPMNPIHWFLSGKEDIRSSFYLEDAATEFHIQGLELDWSCITWDADFRRARNGWQFFSFKGSKWQNVNKAERKIYLKNAYRVLLTRARQGMVIVVPEGDFEDLTRKPEYYEDTFEYLKGIGFQIL